MTSDLDLAQAFIEASFDRAENERLLRGAGESVPHFLLLRTRLGCIWRFHAELSQSVIRDLANLAGREPALTDPIESAALPERQAPLGRILEAEGRAVEIKRVLLLESSGARARSSGPVYARANDEDGLEGIVARTPLPRVLSVPWALRSRVAPATFSPFADALYFSAPAA